MKFDVARVHPPTEKLALALAMQAWPEAERAAYEQSLRKLIEAGQEQSVALIAARRGKELAAAQVALVLPGRVAIVWPPCYAAPESALRPELEPALFACTLRAASEGGARLAQGLTNPDDAAAVAAFERGGFSRAAELLYLAAPPDGTPHPPHLPFELVPAGSEEELAAIVDRTYVETLDCPSLDGMRETADALAGYRAVGTYRPDLWYLVRDAGQDVGCLLLNAHPDVNHLEIVYLALAPEVRGRGWGRKLAEWARRRAAKERAEHVVLAVDATNGPALRLYEAAGFSLFDRRLVWVAALKQESQGVCSK